LVTSIRIGIIA